MASSARRYRSVDVLRGMDMLIILGVDVLTYRLANATGAPWAERLSASFSHSAWVGLTPYDLVFPLFIFLSGVSLGLTEGRRDASEMKGRAARRAGILLLLGIAYNFGWDWSPDSFRIPSVLLLIGASGLIATLVASWTTRTAARLGAAAALLGVLTCLQLLVPVPGFGPGVLTPEGSINGLIDRAVLPGRLYGGTFDPEGVLSLLAGGAVAICGTVAGKVLREASSAGEAALKMASGGLGLVLLGLVLTPLVPPIKKLWTLSFDLMAVGFSALLLAFFVWLLDRQSSPGVPILPAIGANSILAYIGARFLVYPFTWGVSGEIDPAAGVAVVAGFLVLQLAVLEFLHRRGIHWRL